MPKIRIVMIIVNMKATNIWITFLVIDSFEILPRKIPKKIIHTKIRTKEVKKLLNPASSTKKNGKMATIPPKKEIGRASCRERV